MVNVTGTTPTQKSVVMTAEIALNSTRSIPIAKYLVLIKLEMVDATDSAPTQKSAIMMAEIVLNLMRNIPIARWCAPM